MRDDGWFFDTELLVLAQRRGLRIHEVPVDWVDDPDSRVAIVRTALDDLRGVARLMAAGPVARFMGVGVLSHARLRAALPAAARRRWAPTAPTRVALALTAVGNTAANRRFTFGVRGRAGLVRQHAMGALVFVLTLGLTSGALAVLHGLDATPTRPLELAVLIVGEHGRDRDPLRRAAHLGVPLGVEAPPAARADVNGGWVGSRVDRPPGAKLA